MAEKGGTLEWVRYDVRRHDSTSKGYEYNFKLKEDTIIYKQYFVADTPFRWIIFCLNNSAQNPYCKNNDKISFYIDNPPKKDTDYLISERKNKREMIFCYGLSVNGVPVISSIWLCKRDPIFSFLLILSLFLSLPVLAMFFIDLGSPIKTEDSKETYRTDTLIEKADAYWTKGAENKQKNYKKAEQLYLHILKGNPQDFRALSMYALMLFEQRRYDEADVIYESMNRLDSGTAKIVADNYSKIEGCEEREKYWRKKSKNSKVV